ncbi:hypothetical protein [Pigmentiphaga daeguensis]|uniref:Uncharacterized protein n=1 Tax=Pigmentiphaga daeguensis TaxID=414049 RepID=A0ABN1D2Y8_9BURK
MATNWKELVKGAALTGTAASVYTAPAATQTTIQAASATNATGAPITVAIYVVPSGEAFDAKYRVALCNVPAGGVSTPWQAINHKLEAGAQIYADGNGANLTISGAEYLPNT